jgi:YebC/PmpR family DNA-binding regulatory protein
MAGHNKWTQIKRQKGVEDAKKSKLFSVLAKTITLEAKKVRGDRNSPTLRRAIEKAREGNMPSENIERAIERATGAGETNLESVTYEGYGPGGIAMLIEVITDNTNRANQEIKHLLSANGGSMATPGAASWAFSKNSEGEWQATTPLQLSEADLPALTNLIEILEAHDDVQHVYTNHRH